MHSLLQLARQVALYAVHMPRQCPQPPFQSLLPGAMARRRRRWGHRRWWPCCRRPRLVRWTQHPAAPSCCSRWVKPGGWSDGLPLMMCGSRWNTLDRNAVCPFLLTISNTPPSVLALAALAHHHPAGQPVARGAVLRGGHGLRHLGHDQWGLPFCTIMPASAHSSCSAPNMYRPVR